MIWQEEQLGVYRFGEGGSTPYIPLRADLSVKAEKIWVCAYGEYSGVSELPAVVDLLGCDGYEGTLVNALNVPGLGIVTNSIPLDMVSGIGSAWLDGNYALGMFGNQWRYDVTGAGARKFPRLTIQFQANPSEDYPDPQPVWASAKILYGWSTESEDA